MSHKHSRSDDDSDKDSKYKYSRVSTRNRLEIDSGDDSGTDNRILNKIGKLFAKMEKREEKRKKEQAREQAQEQAREQAIAQAIVQMREENRREQERRNEQSSEQRHINRRNAASAYYFTLNTIIQDGEHHTNNIKIKALSYDYAVKYFKECGRCDTKFSKIGLGALPHSQHDGKMVITDKHYVICHSCIYRKAITEYGGNFGAACKYYRKNY